ncbi:MAG: 30S ribosomal protein S17e [Candidatus Pacearchaeota archaeon]
MGRIKSALIKRTSEQLLADMSESFTTDFEKNKRILSNVMPSKRIRNMVAGYITRIKKSYSKQIKTSLEEK